MRELSSRSARAEEGGGEFGKFARSTRVSFGEHQQKYLKLCQNAFDKQTAQLSNQQDLDSDEYVGFAFLRCDVHACSFALSCMLTVTRQSLAPLCLRANENTDPCYGPTAIRRPAMRNGSLPRTSSSKWA